MQITNLKLFDNSAVCCTFDVTFIKMGMIIRDLRLMNTGGKKWIAFPSKQYEKDGKKKYFSYIAFTEGRKEVFEKKVIDLLLPMLVPTLPREAETPSLLDALVGECPF